MIPRLSRPDRFYCPKMNSINSRNPRLANFLFVTQGSNISDIIFGKLTARMALAFWLISPSSSFHISDVFKVRSGSQMTWPNAPRIIALMEYIQTVWYRANE